MNIIVLMLLVGLFLASIALDQAYRALPLKELKRRARAGRDHRAAAIYKMYSYGASLQILLWLAGSVSAGLLTIKAASASTWLGLLVVIAASWLFVASRHHSGINSFSWKLAAALAPPVSTLLSYLQPLLGRLALRLHPAESHYHLFEKEDLLDLLQRQAHKPANRVAESDLKLAVGALTFSDKKVVDIMQPGSSVRFVGRNEDIGPLLMDELHQTGNKYFPVVENPKAAKPEIIGSLYLKDIIMNAANTKVSDVMKREVCYINEACSLHQVLAAFIKAQAHIFIVTNSFEEIVGVITIDKLLEQITGQTAADDDFDNYGNILAVAGLDPDQPLPKQAEAPAEPAEA